MTKKIFIATFVLCAVLLLSGCGEKKAEDNSNSFTATEIVTGTASLKMKEKADKDLAIAKAKELWRAKFLEGEDLSDGPCISNEVIPDWVADIAHEPRETVDELPQNQCTAFRDGTAQHFVELDPNGNVIRAL